MYNHDSRQPSALGRGRLDKRNYSLLSPVLRTRGQNAPHASLPAVAPIPGIMVSTLTSDAAWPANVPNNPFSSCIRPTNSLYRPTRSQYSCVRTRWVSVSVSSRPRTWPQRCTVPESVCVSMRHRGRTQLACGADLRELLLQFVLATDVLDVLCACHTEAVSAICTPFSPHGQHILMVDAHPLHRLFLQAFDVGALFVALALREELVVMKRSPHFAVRGLASQTRAGRDLVLVLGIAIHWFVSTSRTINKPGNSPETTVASEAASAGEKADWDCPGSPRAQTQHLGCYP